MLQLGETMIALLVILLLNPCAFGQPVSSSTITALKEAVNTNFSTFTTPGKRLVFKRPIGRQPVINVPIQDYARIVAGDHSTLEANETLKKPPIVAALIQSNQTEGQGGNGTEITDKIDPSWDEMDLDSINGTVPDNGDAQKLMRNLSEIWNDIQRSPLMIALIGGSLLGLFMMGCSCGILLKTWCCSQWTKKPDQFHENNSQYCRMKNEHESSTERLGWQFHAGNEAPVPRKDSNHAKVNVYQIQDPRLRKNSPMSRSDANLAMIQPVFRPSRPAQYWNTSLPAARHSTAVSLQDAGGYTLPHVLRNGNPDLGHGVSLKSIGTGRTDLARVSAPGTMRLSLLKDRNENEDEVDENRAESPMEAFPPPPPPEGDSEEFEDKRVSSSGMSSFLRNGPKSNQSNEMSTYDWDNVEHI